MMRESFARYALTRHRRTAAAATTGNRNGEKKAKPKFPMQARDAGKRETLSNTCKDGNRWPAGDQLMMQKARGERCGEETRIREERKEEPRLSSSLL
jgi:hypothetical protein